MLLSICIKYVLCIEGDKNNRVNIQGLAINYINLGEIETYWYWQIFELYQINCV